MIDKELVKKRFRKSLNTYEENAVVQKVTADKLIQNIEGNEFENILEIGSATGLLTKKIKEKIKYKRYSANDIVAESKEYVQKIIQEAVFIEGDIEETKLNEKYDLIISNASLQWCRDIKRTILKLYEALNKDGLLAISIFADNNLKEIKTVFEIKNTLYKPDDLKSYLEKLNLVYFKEDEIKLYYNNLNEILRHLKLTGVNAIKEMRLTKSSLLNYDKQYKKLYSQDGRVYLTYNPLYIILKKL